MKNIWQTGAGMRVKKIKIIVAAAVVFSYFMLLLYLRSIQSDFDVRIGTKQESYTFSADVKQDYIVEVLLDNKANRMLSSAEGSDIFLSYHLYDAQGNLLASDHIRTPLEHNIYSGDSDWINLHISPLKRGSYQIGIDLVQESVTWFQDKEQTEKRISVTVI